MSRPRRICRFTLLELLVSMGVFAILMLALMQFFTSAQGIWSRSNSKSDIFSDARIAMNFFSQAFTARYYNADDMNAKTGTDPIFWKCKPTKRTIKDSENHEIELYIYDFAILTLDTDSKGVISENDPYSPYRIKYFQFVKEDDRIKLKYAVASDRKEDSSKTARASNWIRELLNKPEDLPDDLTATVILDNICNVTVYFNGSALSSPTVDQSGVLTVAFSVVDADTVTRLKAMGKSFEVAYADYYHGHDTVAAGLIAGSIQTFQGTVNLE